MSQFEVRIHGRSPADGRSVLRICRTPALDPADAMRRARGKAIAAGVRLPLVYAVTRLPT